MKVLVTGSEGFIGSHLIEALVKNKYKVRALVLYNSFNSWGWLDSLSPEIKKKIEVKLGDVRDSENINQNIKEVLVCGGGRKNKVLLEKIKKNTLQNIILQPIDDYGIDGDFVESQAFAFLAIRSVLKLPISFPETTGCNKPTPGGVLVKY